MAARIMSRILQDRLAVCSWSLQPKDPAQLFGYLKEIGIPRLQIALDPLREHPQIWGRFGEQARERGVQPVSGMFGCVGEDYTTMETIRQTGGIVPDATWDQNWRNIHQTAGLAKNLGLKLVTFHAGFLPHEPSAPGYSKLLERLKKVAAVFGENGMDLALETGQETGDTLRAFLEQLKLPNVGVNFDPANMILYDKGDPIAALRTLAPWLKQCHIKDGLKTRTPGTWGEEVVAGKGQVNWKEFFAVLDEKKFSGYCAIEREAGTQRVADIRAAREFVGRCKAVHGSYGWTRTRSQP